MPHATGHKPHATSHMQYATCPMSHPNLAANTHRTARIPKTRSIQPQGTTPLQGWMHRTLPRPGSDLPRKSDALNLGRSHWRGCHRKFSNAKLGLSSPFLQAQFLASHAHWRPWYRGYVLSFTHRPSYRSQVLDMAARTQHQLGRGRACRG